MQYSELLAGLGYTGAPPMGEAAAVAQDSRKVQPGTAFVCVAGRAFDGHDYAKAALDAGAGMIVTQRPLGLPHEVTVADSRAAYSRMCQNFFGRPADGLTLVGVTGTNGKTTVSTVLWQVLGSLGVKCGLIGTSVCRIGTLEVPAKFTTPEAWDLNALLAQMGAAGCTHVVMEASSQALEQGRLHGLRFALSVFTNLSQDHLDYHGGMHAYYEAKKILPDQSDAALINMDDAAGRAMLDEAQSGVKRSFSVKSDRADFVARNADLRVGGVRFAFLGDGFLCPVAFAMPGMHSVANALAAAGAAVMLGQKPDEVANALGQVKGVRGRSEVLYSGAFTIICDFAHTADALEQLLSALRPQVEGRMVVVFGCAGDRDAAKRPAMGQAVVRWADEIILTADNPRTEPVRDTMKEVLPVLEESGKPYTVEEDRAEAVQRAADGLKAGDMLVLCGKGHEDYQVMDGYTLFLDEHEIIKTWLERNGLLQ